MLVRGMRIDTYMAGRMNTLALSARSVTDVPHRPLRAVPALAAVLSLSLCMATGAHAQTSGSFSLFGSPRCTEWNDMTPDARLVWTRAYLSTISKAYLEIRGADKKAKTPQDIEQAVKAVDAHCTAQPEAQAADGIAPFLR